MIKRIKRLFWVLYGLTMVLISSWFLAYETTYRVMGEAVDINDVNKRIVFFRERLNIPDGVKIDVKILNDNYGNAIVYRKRDPNNFQLRINSKIPLVGIKHEMYHIYRSNKLGAPDLSTREAIREEFLAEIYTYTNLDLTRLNY